MASENQPLSSTPGMHVPATDDVLPRLLLRLIVNGTNHVKL